MINLVIGLELPNSRSSKFSPRDANLARVRDYFGYDDKERWWRSAPTALSCSKRRKSRRGRMANDRIPQCEKIRRYTGIVIVRTRPVERTIVLLEKKIRSKDWGLRIRRNVHVSRFTFYVSRILFRSNYYARVRWGGGFESNRIRNWDLFETSVHSPDENYSVGRFRSNDTLETTWLHATVGRIDRDTRTVLETRRKRKRSRVLGKWFARACRARDIEDRSLRASSSRCETRLVRSLSHPTIQSIFPLFKRIVPAFIFLKVRFKTNACWWHEKG